jgi:hypothetical protein
MNDIILTGVGNDGIVFEVHSLIDHLEQVSDERKTRG